MRIPILAATMTAMLASLFQCQDTASVCDALHAATGNSPVVWINDSAYGRAGSLSKDWLNALSDREWYELLRMTKSERAELRANVVSQSDPRFKPSCAWSRETHDFTQSMGRPIVSFSKPVFSRDGKLALFDLAISPDSALGQSLNVCLVRKVDSVWKPRCYQAIVS